ATEGREAPPPGGLLPGDDRAAHPATLGLSARAARRRHRLRGGPDLPPAHGRRGREARGRDREGGVMLVLLLSGCAFAPGQGFGALESARLEARLEPGPARDLGGGEILTQEGYAVRLDAVERDVGALERQAGS
ncbi:MAG: hypothetical protein ACK559_05635, partial [bacterium]